MKPETLRAVLASAAIGLLVALFSCRELPSGAERAQAAYPSNVKGSPDVAVALARGSRGVKVSVSGRFDLVGSGRVIPIENSSLAPVVVRSSGGGLAVGEVRLAHARLKFRPARGAEVRVEGVPVPGSVLVARESEGPGVAGVVVMDVESYACAALSRAADWRNWSDEALAANAVAIRTRALYRRALARSGGRTADFDEPGLLEALRSGAHRSARVALAVNRTRGLVLTWGRRLFPAFLTRSCGGRTEDASKVLTAGSITPLSGVECPFCRSAQRPAREWKVRLSTKRITEMLKPHVEGPNVYRLGRVKRVEPASTGKSGRVTWVRVQATYATFEMSAESFRAAVGEELIPAAPLSITDAGPETVEFKGRGEGPGVGLCQLGAERMAREGKPFRELLRRYFPGAELAELPYRKRRAGRDSPDGRRP